MRDIIWLNWSFGEWNQKNQDDEINNQHDNQDENPLKRKGKRLIETTLMTPKHTLLKEMKKLQGWLNPDPSRIVDA